MTSKSPVENIADAIQHFEQGLSLLRAAEQGAWNLQNASQAMAEYVRELEERADPMNDGLPLIDHLQGRDHADESTR
jgi:hypothetical protein